MSLVQTPLARSPITHARGQSGSTGTGRSWNQPSDPSPQRNPAVQASHGLDAVNATLFRYPKQLIVETLERSQYSRCFPPAETKGHFLTFRSRLWKKKKIYLKVHPSRAVVNFYGVLSHFITCGLCLRSRQSSARWSFVMRHLLTVLSAFRGLTSEASHDIPPDPALTLWHRRNAGDGDRQRLLPDLKGRRKLQRSSSSAADSCQTGR